MKTNFLLVCLAIVLVVPAKISAQSKIDDSKSSLNRTSSSSSPHSTRGSHSNKSSSDDDDDIGPLAELLLDGVIYIVGGVIYYVPIGDYANENHLYNSLAPYPYYYENEGNFHDNSFDTVYQSQFRIDVKEQLMYSNKDLYGNSLQAKIRPINAFSIQADYFQLFEKDHFNNETDALSLFYFNFAYDRLRFERFNLGWTLGASYIGSGVNKAGFSWGTQAEYFFKKRISLLASAKWSVVNGKPVHAYEGNVRYHKKKFFATAGFTQLIIASPHYNFATLGAGIYF